MQLEWLEDFIDLIISATLFERIVGMSMKYRPARVGSFAQNIHEFQRR